MALDVDGYAVLRAMADAPEAFPDIRTEVPRAARALVVRQLKARSLRVARLRLIREVLGPESFALIADGMSEAEVKGLVTRLDPHHPSLKSATPGWHRHRLAALAAGEAPARKDGTGAKALPADAPAPAEAERALASRPFAAVWDGRDHDAPEGKLPARKDQTRKGDPGKRDKSGKDKKSRKKKG